MPPALILCPHCECHAKTSEITCPSCGEPLRTREGALPRAAVAVLLGLTTATVGALSASCSSSSTGVATPAYGIAQTTTTSSSDTGGANTSSSSGSAAAYGVAQTTSTSSTGTGGESADGG